MGRSVSIQVPFQVLDSNVWFVKSNIKFLIGKSATINDVSKMPREKELFAVKTAHESFATRDSRFERAKFIKQKFESKYG